MNDMIYEILLNCNIHDIINLCQIKEFHHICHDEHFWINKFSHDHLNYVFKNNFIDSYITAMVHQLITMIKNQNDLFQDLYIKNVKITYTTLTDIWYITDKMPKMIEEYEVLNYLKKIIYMHGNIKYRNKILDL